MSSPLQPARLSPAHYLGLMAVAALTSLLVAIVAWALLPPRSATIPVTATASTPTPFIATSMPATAIPQATATPSVRFAGDVGMGGYYLVTLQQVGDLPPNTRIRISSLTMGDDGWTYEIVAEDEQRIAHAREDQIGYIPGVVPGATPTAAFDAVLGMGVKWVALREAVGGFSAGVTVRVSVAHLGPTGWIYSVTPDEVTYFDVPEWQLAYLPNVTPGAPTPTFTH